MTIYYLTPDKASPKGGVRMIYHHVDALNAHGFDAAVVHARQGFRCQWFANETRIVYTPVVVAPHDVLVLPEQVSPEAVARLAPGTAKVLFNQNVYRTFDRARFHGRDVMTPYTNSDLVGVITASVDAQQYLEYVFPHVRITRVPYYINDAVFRPARELRGHYIAAMPRKRPREFAELKAILALRGVLDRWPIEVIDGVSECDVARMMQRSALFISLAKDEGFGLPAAEAIACGCHVIGFDGRGGREYFVPPYADSVEDGDVIALARRIEAFVDSYEEGRPEHDRAAQEGSAKVLSKYSSRAQSVALSAFFSSILPPAAESNGPSGMLRRRDLRNLFPSTSRARAVMLRAGRRILR